MHQSSLNREDQSRSSKDSIAIVLVTFMGNRSLVQITGVQLEMEQRQTVCV